MISKLALFVCFGGGVDAFHTPAGSARGAVTVVGAKSKSIPFLEAPKALDGSYAGDRGFDPVGFTNLDWDMSEAIVPLKSSGRPSDGISMLYWMREAELKHGRICMLAIAGWVSVDFGFRFPGAKYADLTPLTAHNAMVASGNMGFMLLCVFVLELINSIAIYQAANGSGRKAGEFALDPFGLAVGPNKKLVAEAEIAHCRTAMVAFSGICTQAALFNIGFPYY